MPTRILLAAAVAWVAALVWMTRAAELRPVEVLLSLLMD